MAHTIKLLLAFIVLCISACNPGSEPHEGKTEQVVRAEASAFLDILRAGKWDDAVPFVSLDAVTRSRMGITKDANNEVIRSKVKAWFQSLYGKIRPGPVHGIRLDPNDPGLALVDYRHGDIDGFHMRLVGSRWLYTLDWEPRKKDKHSRK